ncbi:MAG: hypothetical protein NC084_02075 [Bacteroides sp.]|nr:hypothetical protein [Eubacterium sp.]MCM1417325.1 hypothetical protein [Roseburia sp.]MCM1461482.1 hypothetical protein [Bacteroides sp.]
MRKFISFTVTTVVVLLLLSGCQGQSAVGVTTDDNITQSSVLTESVPVSSEETTTVNTTETTTVTTTKVTTTSPVSTENSATTTKEPEQETKQQETPSDEYNVNVKVNCVENLAFSRYDVKVYVDDELQGTVEHGGSDSYTVQLKEGTYPIRFAKTDDETVFGETKIKVSKNDTFQFEISCTAKKIKFENQSDSILAEETEDDKPDETTTALADTPQSGTTETTASSNGIRPEFKEAMDSYEAFFDEYCKIMTAYAENPSDLSLMLQYLEYLEKYSEMADKLDEIGDDDLSEAELLYYTEVMSRINKKLLALG